MKYTIKDYKERFYMGVEYIGGLTVGSKSDVKKSWTEFFENDYQYLENAKEGGNFIGLQCFPPDFLESKMLDYFILCEVNEVTNQEGFISKKLPEGKYLLFPIKFSDKDKEIIKVHTFLKKTDIKVSNSFDYEDYLVDEDYSKKNAVLNFCLKLIE